MDDRSPIRVRLTEDDEDDCLITRDLPTEIKDTREVATGCLARRHFVL